MNETGSLKETRVSRDQDIRSYFDLDSLNFCSIIEFNLIKNFEIFKELKFIQELEVWFILELIDKELH